MSSPRPQTCYLIAPRANVSLRCQVLNVGPKFSHSAADRNKHSSQRVRQAQCEVKNEVTMSDASGSDKMNSHSFQHGRNGTIDFR